MWLIAGTLPDPDFPLYSPATTLYAPDAQLCHGKLQLGNRRAVPVERGTAALVASCLAAGEILAAPTPNLLLAGDIGSGAGSRQLYAWLEKHMESLQLKGIFFHYLFPDLDWHNRLLVKIHSLARKPLLMADAGFMYVAKMSGYASEYDLFTPDAGELAFLADEKAPHPFYTRGFLLEQDHDVQPLLQHVFEHDNAARNLLIKGSTDYIVSEGQILHTIQEPSVPAMECIGGTGDIVAGVTLACIMAGYSIPDAMCTAAQAVRNLASDVRPTPATQAKELIMALPHSFKKSLQQKNKLSKDKNNI